MIERKIWDDITEAIPTLLLAIGIPLTYSINDGLAFGFVSYPLVKLAAGRRRSGLCRSNSLDCAPLRWV